MCSVQGGPTTPVFAEFFGHAKCDSASALGLTVSRARARCLDNSDW